MRTVLVTGTDTGVGKTRAVGALAGLLAGPGVSRVQIVKVVETGVSPGQTGDAEQARVHSGANVDPFTLVSFAAPLSPPAAAARENRRIAWDDLLDALSGLPDCDWRIVEGAGGIATPLDDTARDWVDFAADAAVDVVIVVVPDRLGAINQARLAHARAGQSGRPVGIWLNAAAPVEPAVAESNREGLRAAGLPLWTEQGYSAAAPADPAALRRQLEVSSESGAIASGTLIERCKQERSRREEKGLWRQLRITSADLAGLNLADNDYLDLARDPALAAAVAEAAEKYGTSASASPLITGWGELHARATERLCAWHGLPHGMIWSSGFAANAAILGGLPARGDLVLADRLIHHSMINGLLRSGARLLRYPHLQLDRLEELLERAQSDARQVFVVTETVFSMDGDYPDLRQMAALKQRHGFCWIVDEAHALGWYGSGGSGLVNQAGVAAAVDVLVGTFGKALASGGAYALFRDVRLRDHLVNTAGEFVYSTALPPTSVAAALAAMDRMETLAADQPAWHATSRDFRQRLRAAGWSAPEGDSPIVPVAMPDPEIAMAIADRLRESGIRVGAVRPPTVPAGTSRLRISIKRTFGTEKADRLLEILGDGEAAS